VVTPGHPEGSADRALLAIAAHADESEAHVREVERFSQNLPKGSYLTCDTFGSRDGGRLADLRVLVPGRADVRTNLGCRAARSSPGGWAVGPMAYRVPATSWASAAHLLPLAALSRPECHSCRA